MRCGSSDGPDGREEEEEDDDDDAALDDVRPGPFDSLLFHIDPIAFAAAINAGHHQALELSAAAAEATKHFSVLKPEHENSRATRRGPMDEMRQLVRILVKLLPRSAHNMPCNETAGGGNRMSEEQIKEYLRNTLGSECPQPKWGLPNGWGMYLAELFTWAVGRDVSHKDAMDVAMRLPGRSWEVVEEEIIKLGEWHASGMRVACECIIPPLAIPSIYLPVRLSLSLSLSLRPALPSLGDPPDADGRPREHPEAQGG